MGSIYEFRCEDFDVQLGVFAGMVSEDTDNTGRANMSALKVKIEYD